MEMVDESMVKGLFLFLALTFSQLASAGFCDWLMSHRPVKQGQVYELAYELLAHHHTPQLLRVLDKAKIVEKKSRRFWQSRLSLKYPGFLFLEAPNHRPTIVARLSEWTSEEDKKKALWELAVLLYEAKIDRKIYSLRELKHQFQWDDKKLLDVSMNGTDEELMSYFMVTAPEQWSRQWVNELKAMQAELYQLLLDLNLPEVIDKLTERDPGRYALSEVLFGWLWSYNPKLNKKDFLNLFRFNGRQNFDAAIDNRYLKQTKAKWYSELITRVVIISAWSTLAPSIVEAIPQLPRAASMTYHLVTNYASIQDRIREGQQKMQEDFQNNLEQEVLREYFRLQKELNDLKGKGEINSPKAKEIEEDLRDLTETYPEILKATGTNN